MQGGGKKTREVRLCVGWLGMGGVVGGLIGWMVCGACGCSDGTRNSPRLTASHILSLHFYLSNRTSQ